MRDEQVRKHLPSLNTTKSNEGDLIMSDSTINVSESFFKGLDYKIQKLSILSDKLDILAYEARQVCRALQEANKIEYPKKKD